jgi:hypothetical protein
MQRTLNYTGRTKIEQKQALFSFRDNGDGPPEFDVVFTIDPDEYPENASLYVEAYYKETRQRFDFGTVANIRPPQERVLDEIDLSGPTLFRVLIVDDSGRHGMLLASGDQFRADAGKDEDKDSLISVRKYDLGQLTWKVHFESGMAPELHVNSRISGAIEKVRSDPTFQSLIFPAMLKEVLTYYLWNEEDEEGSEHCSRWMAFASLFAEERPNGEDPLEMLQWVEEVVREFSERFELTDMLMTTERGG